MTLKKVFGSYDSVKVGYNFLLKINICKNTIQSSDVGFFKSQIVKLKGKHVWR